MRLNWFSITVVSTLITGLAIVGCDGGGGGEAPGGYSTYENAVSTTDQPGSTTEKPNGSGGTTTKPTSNPTTNPTTNPTSNPNCFSGTYTCSANGQSVTVSFSSSNGKCMGLIGSEFSAEFSNGNITSGGSSVGTYKSSGSNLTSIVMDGVTATCTKK